MAYSATRGNRVATWLTARDEEVLHRRQLIGLDCERRLGQLEHDLAFDYAVRRPCRNADVQIADPGRVRVVDATGCITLH